MEMGKISGHPRNRRSRAPTAGAGVCACACAAAVAVRGRRKNMEDAVTLLPEFADVAERAGSGGGPFHYFGVFDGHGGSQAAVLCRDRLHGILRSQLEFGHEDIKEEEARWRRAAAASFSLMDDEVAAELSETSGSPGTTAAVAIVGPQYIVVANCGDSRTVLSRGGAAIPLSMDHKPDRVDERTRIEECGGRVIQWNGYRVLGVLATSRSIGDRYLKPYVIPDPDVTFTLRCPNSDEFLIVATDGLWDTVPNDTACDVVRRCFASCVESNPSAVAATLLAKLAIARGSSDNVSVIVVDLRHINL